MLQRLYSGLDQEIFTVNKKPDKVVYIKNLSAYNKKEGLALSKDEITYLEGLAKKIGRPLTDSEVFGFSQVNSEHCRHKIFNAEFIIDGQVQPASLFSMISSTHRANPQHTVVAYSDNAAVMQGGEVQVFRPRQPAGKDNGAKICVHLFSDFYMIRTIVRIKRKKAMKCKRLEELLELLG